MHDSTDRRSACGSQCRAAAEDWFFFLSPGQYRINARTKGHRAAADHSGTAFTDNPGYQASFKRIDTTLARLALIQRPAPMENSAAAGKRHINHGAVKLS